jgi:hypothetical protein
VPPTLGVGAEIIGPTWTGRARLEIIHLGKRVNLDIPVVLFRQLLTVVTHLGEIRVTSSANSPSATPRPSQGTPAARPGHPQVLTAITHVAGDHGCASGHAFEQLQGNGRGPWDRRWTGSTEMSLSR